MKYRAEIDGLRAMAVLSVILFHAGFEWFSGGFIGIDVFFVISGYLITTIIISEMAEGKFSIVNFYERRARRILPALFFVMAACLPFAWLWLTPNDLKNFGQSLIAVSTFSSNILFWLEGGYFDTATELKPLLHTWSLAVEEQYYILYPIFLMLTWRLGVKRILILLSIVFLLSLGIAQWGAYNSPIATFYLLPTRGWELLVGVFAAFYLKYNTHLKSQTINQALSLLGFSMIVYSIIVFDETTPFPSLYTLITTIGTGLLILCAVPKTAVHKLLSLKPIVGIGLISYSAYLWHQPLLAYTKYMFLEEVSNILLFSLCIVSLVMAWFSWRFIEKPFRQKLTFKRKFFFKCSLVGILFFTFAGLWLASVDDVLKYYPPEKQKVLSRFIDPSDYVHKLHKNIRLKEFDKTNKKKDILIIGDSHSEDLVNAAFEGDLNKEYEFSSYYIPNSCGALFIRDKDFINNLSNECKKIQPLNNNNLLKQISIADQIWIISSWRDDHVKTMNKSLSNLLNLNENVILFGTKNFYARGFKWYSDNDIQKWEKPVLQENYLNSLKETTAINDSLRKVATLLNINFANTQHLICNQKDFCSNYINGDIISYDGVHLTPHGARILGISIKIWLSEQNINEDLK